MANLHVSRHTLDTAQKVAEVGFVGLAVILAAISSAVLLYAWFIA